MARAVSNSQHSSTQISDVNSTLEYGHVHRLARQVLIGALFALAVALVLLMSLDGRPAAGKQLLLGGGAMVVSLALIGVAIRRRMQPNLANIVISRSGILLRDVSEAVIPWREIQGVGLERVSHVRDLTSTQVVKLEVSPAFYQRYTRGRWFDSVIGINGDPCEIYISYYHSLPVDEAHDAILRRWKYFKREAGSLYSDEELQPSESTVHSTVVPSPRAGAIRAAVSAGPIGALASLFKEQTLGERLAAFSALAVIGALLTNIAGVWSTAEQLRNRASHAEWQAKMQQFDADMKASDEEQRKSRIKWDAISKCMEDMGSAREDPKCMEKIK